MTSSLEPKGAEQVAKTMWDLGMFGRLDLATGRRELGIAARGKYAD